MAENKSGLKVVEEKAIVFYEDELIAVKVEDGTIYVPVRRLCDNLGIDWSAQRQRINRDEVLSEALLGVVITTTPNQHRPELEMACLPLDLIPGWLFGVQTSRVKEEIRDKLIRYRRECFRVLWDAFKGDVLPQIQPLATGMTPAEQALAHIESLHILARNQVVMERWLANHDRRLGDVEGIVDDLRLRVYGSGELISPEQAAEIAARVKAVAHHLSRTRPEGKNWYQSIYGEMYRRFGITGYKQVPAARFAAVMQWLSDYGQALNG